MGKTRETTIAESVPNSEPVPDGTPSRKDVVVGDHVTYVDDAGEQCFAIVTSVADGSQILTVFYPHAGSTPLSGVAAPESDEPKAGCWFRAKAEKVEPEKILRISGGHIMEDPK